MTRVLVIDDCEDLRMVVSELLDDEGFAVTLAADTEQALSELKHKPFDVVLCDLVMPLVANSAENACDSAMVGVHCINQISKEHPTLPIIAISGELTGNPLGAVKNFGASATLSKPFGREELLKTLSSVLQP